MPIKSREANKFFIESFVLSETDNPEIWTDDDLQQKVNGHAIIGYLFSTKSMQFGNMAKTLNLYLINKKYYHKSVVSLLDLKNANYVFNTLCEAYPDQKDYAKRHVFLNPPIEEWIKTKENWCKKLAMKISDQFSYSFIDAMSDIYYTICRLYSKKHVYMGNLGYIQSAVYNAIRCDYRNNQHKVNYDNNNVLSLETVLFTSKDGDIITLEDTLGKEDEQHKERDYRDFKQECQSLLESDFSSREINQIFTQKSTFLPTSLYKRLLKWRKNNKEALKELRSWL